MKLYLIPTLLAPETEQYMPSVMKELLPTISHYFVENERTARRFLSGMNLGITIQELSFYTLDKSTTADEVKKYFNRIKKGTPIGVMSESGCPGIADPGARAAQVAHEMGIEVIPIPGPSSIFMALMASGLSGQNFTFHGYLPIDKEQRKKALKQLEINSTKRRQAQIFIETPYRNDAILKDVFSSCHPMTRLCIACNLTAEDGYVKTQNIGQWKRAKTEIGKKPTVFILMG